MNARRISARNAENGKIPAQGRITKRDFVINQILEKNLFSFFPFSPCSLEKDLWRGRMCHPTWKEKIPVTRVRSRHSHRLCVERIFFLNFKTDISSTVTNVYKLSISIRSRYFDEEEKKEIERDYSFARKENRFKLIRRFALWMQQFYISFDKI